MLPSYSESRSLKYDPWESFKAIQRAWNNEKYTVDTPLTVLRDALIEERVKKGYVFDTEVEKEKVQEQLEQVKQDEQSLQDIVNFLNNTNGTRSVCGEDVVNND